MQNKPAWNAIRIGVWAIAGLVVVLGLVFAVTVVALPGCTSCHDSASFVSQTQASSHGKIDCVRCHADAGVPHRITYAYNELFGQVLHIAPAEGGPITAIPDSTCRSCHADVMRKKVTANGLSILHSECSKGRVCTDCHSDTAHGTAVKWIKTVNMNQCLDCHNTDRVRSDCNLCHVEKSEEERIQSGEWAVTHGSSWKTTHGMGDLKTCAACHPDDYCVRCHGIPMPHGRRFHPLPSERRSDQQQGLRSLPPADILRFVPWPADAAPGRLHAAPLDASSSNRARPSARGVTSRMTARTATRGTSILAARSLRQGAAVMTQLRRQRTK